ncbi:hypothetical protein PHLGIDRAFT_408172 [Phlebiopsis gigantea 11061_1 CR5-6]|uniref:Aminoglycoside phosphotransferase domain-containing protein n=1 Tax=Phlebiopsis gigantea (strain 11061_1 CR5-6) TaxID=745531 RepID=A0A0C3PMB3_PHLG1|nr:hypothetical protein PHLGIDRAFT_408172 [Phlebiopsis gigantea 11061_1 CR5-6]
MPHSNDTLPYYYHSVQDIKDDFWAQTEPKVSALKTIISSHFACACGDLSLLDEGAYARVYETFLTTGRRLAARIILPARPVVKTEAEVATMDFVRAKTAIPIPQVHLFCSTRENPVGAEWMVMDFVSGERLIDCWDELSLEAKRRATKDLASVMSELYAFTSSQCGSLFRDDSLNDEGRAKRFGNPPSLPPTADSYNPSGQFKVGPINDFVFTEPLFSAPAERCGPFTSEQSFLEALAYANITDKDERVVKFLRDAREKVIELYTSLHELYRRDVESKLSNGFLATDIFHFSHGDLSDTNILVDKETGEITGLIDWEVSGFRPAWLAAGRAGPLGDHGHEDDDDDDEDDAGEREPCFCLYRMFYEDPCSNPAAVITPDDKEVRESFLAELHTHNDDLYIHHLYGKELREAYESLRYIFPGNIKVWLAMYHDYRWDASTMGEFPFDVKKWTIESYDWWKKIVDEGMRL